jgi:hypothetical protein
MAGGVELIDRALNPDPERGLVNRPGESGVSGLAGQFSPGQPGRYFGRDGRLSVLR